MATSRVRINLRGRTPAPVVPQAEVWPEGVIARYLTVAGEALADPSIAVILTGGGAHTFRRCTGCGDGGGVGGWSEHSVRERAQAHAEKCRALPKPEVA